jgi:uncharacterized membrane-anchored protein
MLWIIFVMLLIMGAVALFASYTMVGGIIQILLVSMLVAIGINRMRRYRGGLAISTSKTKEKLCVSIRLIERQ